MPASGSRNSPGTVKIDRCLKDATSGSLPIVSEAGCGGIVKMNVFIFPVLANSQRNKNHAKKIFRVKGQPSLPLELPGRSNGMLIAFFTFHLIAGHSKQNQLWFPANGFFAGRPGRETAGRHQMSIIMILTRMDFQEISNAKNE
jgi:hypothetical protein